MLSDMPGSLDWVGYLVIGLYILAASPIFGVVIGTLVGWIWRRPFRGAIAGTAGAFLVVAVIYGMEALPKPPIGQKKTPFAFGASVPAIFVAQVVAATIFACIGVWLAGDARPRPTPRDTWSPPGPDEVGRTIGEPPRIC